MSLMKLKASTNVELGGKARTLVLDMNMLCELEEVLKVNVMQNQEFWADVGFTQLRVMVWAMLYKESPRPSIADVGDMMSDCEMSKLTESIMQMWSQDIEKSEGGDKNQATVDPTLG